MFSLPPSGQKNSICRLKEFYFGGGSLKCNEDTNLHARPYVLVKTYGCPSFSPQCCWNCGRKASETCSGCNAARYCGSFCQHKDWERHHLICSPGLQAQPKPISAITAGRVAAAAATAAAAGVSPVGLAGIKAPDSVTSVSSPGGEKASVASRSSTPSTPASAPEANGH